MKCEFEFICDKAWSDLEDIGNDKMKYCSYCHQHVYLAENSAELERLANKKRCAYFRPDHQDGSEQVVLRFLGRVVSK
ncbi:hypothetical protein D1115_16235 [Vibrio alfacsensis]|uniref:CPXCG motif-containing cysteine-rich protein n=1 Tax=Vibrio alfacsensis TaxID=1074311 RepID=A0ABM6YXQ8_9VIBR|nr:hypothetical protein [Vibrio alfacsensis]AXY02585.1 hypothetical protein D1115_16235 [Vibrio alfacsensis]